MPRLTHKVTGVTIDVSEEFAEANKGAYEPADKLAQASSKAPAKSSK